MYTAYPDTEPAVSVISTGSINSGEDRPDPLAKLYSKISQFATTHSAVDFAGCSPSGEKTQYTHSSKMMKTKGGTPPKDYSLAEDLIDLQRFVRIGDYTSALPYYFRLSRYVQ